MELTVTNPMHGGGKGGESKTDDLAIVVDDSPPAAKTPKCACRCPKWVFGLPMCFAAGCITWSAGLVAINLVGDRIRDQVNPRLKR